VVEEGATLSGQINMSGSTSKSTAPLKAVATGNEPKKNASGKDA
jgi:hypothetical protein